MPPKDNIAAESQQYAAQFMPMVQRAQEGTTQAISGAVDRLGQGLEMGLRRQALQQQALQAAQEDERRNRLTASDLATDQIRRTQAMEELQWAREVHSTAMLKYQRRAAKAQAELVEAQAGKATQELGTPPMSRVATDHVAYMVMLTGEKPTRGGGWEKASPEEVEDARRIVMYRPEESATKSAQAAERLEIQRRNAASREQAESLTAINAERDGLQKMIEMTRSRRATTDEEKQARERDIQTLEGQLRDNIQRAKGAGMPVTEPGQNGTAPTAGDDFYDRVLKALNK